MAKPKPLQILAQTMFQPVATVRPRLVFSRDDSSGANLSERQIARILVVEDDYLISAEMDAELTFAGFEVVGIATSADEAIRMAIEEKPDLIIMDIRLEGDIDGIEAAKTIFDSSGIRCIFASAYHNPETRRFAGPCSPLGWLAKPYTMSSLIDAVRTALQDLGHLDD